MGLNAPIGPKKLFLSYTILCYKPITHKFNVNGLGYTNVSSADKSSENLVKIKMAFDLIVLGELINGGIIYDEVAT